MLVQSLVTAELVSDLQGKSELSMPKTLICRVQAPISVKSEPLCGADSRIATSSDLQQIRAWATCISESADSDLSVQIRAFWAQIRALLITVKWPIAFLLS